MENIEIVVSCRNKLALLMYSVKEDLVSEEFELPTIRNEKLAIGDLILDLGEIAGDNIIFDKKSSISQPIYELHNELTELIKEIKHKRIILPYINLSLLTDISKDLEEVVEKQEKTNP